MAKKRVMTLRELKRTKAGKEQRTKIAKMLRKVRTWDKKKQWLRFGEFFSPNEYGAILSRINYFLKRGVKVVRILDLGASSGKYWERMVNWDTHLKGRIQVLCLNPIKTGFRNSKTKKVVAGNLATMNEARLRQLLSKGKFHLATSFIAGAHNPLTEQLLKKRVRRVLVEPKLKKFFLTEENV